MVGPLEPAVIYIKECVLQIIKVNKLHKQSWEFYCKILNQPRPLKKIFIAIFTDENVFTTVIERWNVKLENATMYICTFPCIRWIDWCHKMEFFSTNNLIDRWKTLFLHFINFPFVSKVSVEICERSISPLQYPALISLQSGVIVDERRGRHVMGEQKNI